MGSALSRKQEKEKEKPSISPEVLQYPSPSQLKDSQVRYGASFKEPPKSDLNGYIPAFPTPNKKSDIYHDSGIDNYVLNSCMSPDHAMMKLLDLVSHLTKTSRDDVQKIRAIYKWLTIQDVTKYDITEGPPSDSALYHLLLIRANMESRNQLFKLMAEIAGIKCRLIEGTTRPPSYYYGGTLTSGHKWCVVYVANAWRFVDLDVAAIYNTHNDKINSPKKYKDQQSKNRFSNVDEFFFLTDPYKFIYFNLPDDPQWQLLAEPIAKEIFPEWVALTPAFFSESIETVSETRGIVRAKDGQASFKLVFRPNHEQRLIYHIGKLAGTAQAANENDKILNDLCFMENEGDTRCLSVSLMEIGRYQIVMYVVGIEESTADKKQVCRYFLDVESPDFQAALLPANPRYEYGPGADTRLHRIRAISHQRGIIRTKDGLVKIDFSFEPSSDTRLVAELISRELERDVLRRSILCAINPEGVFTSFVNLPHAGRYLYKLLVQNVLTGTLINVCSYLLISSAAFCLTEQYPVGDNGFIGDLSFGNETWIKPVSHQVALIECYEKGELSLEMEATQKLDLQLTLERSQPGLLDEDLNAYAWFVHVGSQLNVQVTFPEAGLFTLTIFAKPRNQEMIMRPTWMYVINVDRPHQEALPFPTTHLSWCRSCDLRQPLSGYILEDSDITLEVNVPEAKDVIMLTGAWTCHSLKTAHRGGWWKGTIHAGSVGSPFTLAAVFDNKLDYTYLLEYRVLSAREFERIRKRQKEALKIANERLKERERKLNAEKERSALRQQHTANKIADHMSKFNAEKNELISQENEYRRQELERWKRDEEEVRTKILTRESPGTDTEAEVKKQIDDLQEAKNENITTRRSIHKGIASYLVRERLREGTKLRNYDMLCSAIPSFLKSGLKEEASDLTKAKQTLQILQTERDLLQVMKQHDVREIQERIDNIRNSWMYGHLQVIVQEAERLIAAITRVDRLKLPVLGMDKNTIGEIRSYNRPPSGVHRVMQAALLLLGEDEFTTAEWSTCQKMISVVGRESINRRILELDMRSLDPEIVARVKQILSNLELKQVQHFSAGAATFYVWAMGTVEEIENIYPDHGKKKAKPADIKRQREIFGKSTLSERALYTERHEAKTDARNIKPWIS